MERPVKIKQLFKDIDKIEIKGNRDAEITGLSSDSRTVAPGNLFIAKKGVSLDGTQFIGNAIEAGASAILTDLYDPFLPIPQILFSNPGSLEAYLAARYYQRPSSQLQMIGVTGTKGKTTTAYLIRHIFEQLLIPTGLLGTVETIIGSNRIPSRLTTLDAIQNQKFLREMVIQGAKAAVMEVSSHGLEQGRVDAISFDIALFTNLYPDHLDYHKTMENYASAKAKLFHNFKGTAILNADNPWTPWMKGGKKQVCFSLERPADLQATQVKLTQNGSHFVVAGQPFFLPLLGRFNIYNALGAIAVGLEQGATLSRISEILAAFPGVPGRLESVPNPFGIYVFIDYAHNGEALSNVLQTLREACRQKILLVFGCGGGRDPGRRASMGSAAEQYADQIFLTTDNPRGEDPGEIASQILSGCKSRDRIVQIPDRKKAIEQAIQAANRGDVVLIAGKGHEKVQIFLHQTIPFDDVQVAKEALQNRASSAILPFSLGSE